MEEYIDKIKNKFGYSSELCEFLNKIIPLMINHFGENRRAQILNTFSEVEIHLGEGNETYADFMHKKYGPLADTSYPLGAAGVYHNKVSLNEDKELVHNDVVYVFKPINGKCDFSKASFVATIIHEICHAIKEHRNVAVSGDMITRTTGFKKYSYDFLGNEVEDEGLGVGLEEAFNCYDEEVLTSAYFGTEYKTSAYSGITGVIKELMKHEDIKEAVKEAEFGSPLILEVVLCSENYQSLLESTYNIVTYNYLKSDDVYTQEDDELMMQMLEEGYSIKEIKEKIKEILANKDISSKVKKSFETIQNLAKNHSSDKSLSDFYNALMNANAKTLEEISRITCQLNIEDTSKSL